MDEILVGSPSYNIYNKFDKKVEGEKYNNSCSVFKNEGDAGTNEGFELCKKIARNSDDLLEHSNKDESTIYCSHYKYWAYKNIKKFLEDNSKNDSKNSYISKFIKARDSINEAYYTYFCQYDFKNDNATDVLKDKLEEKYLYDYFRNYDSIKTYYTCELVSLSEYENYLNNIIKIYNKHKLQKKCCNGLFLEDCFDYFNCADEFDPKQLLSSLKKGGNNSCSNLEKAEKPENSESSPNFYSSSSHIFSSFYYFTCRSKEQGRDICRMSTTYVEPAKMFNSNTGSVLQFNPISLTSQGQEAPASQSRQVDQKNRISRVSSLSANLNPNGTLQEASESLSASENEKSKVQKSCPGYQSIEGASRLCDEPNVREKGTLGGRWEEYSPHKKFTPFGRRLRKKPSRYKRIDDDVDISYLRQFKIRSPKKVNRNKGSTRLQFAYYSR
ncbi:PIR Superfamily Protein [Plasmodium malariae]|uniref:PIR Superfamily Protein n=1 Tax=Plasmodium malariae TaxID=5858 RepID=A0A1A8X3X3_PLAMA|nr:PIR Superfamily Protein [Plasmodium malariae]